MYFIYLVAIFKETGNDIIFKNRAVFSKSYIPKNILHRHEQIKQIADGLRYILSDQRPTDQAIFGKRGTGKTLVARYVTEELCKITNDVKVFHVSLKHARTDFMAIEKIIDKLIGKSQKGNSLLKGKSFSDGCYTIFNYISTFSEKYVILILDEMNEIKNPDMLLHSLLRVNEIYGDLNGKELSYIFISNSEFIRNVSQGTRSSYAGVTKRVFPPYYADDLRDILKERVQEGLKPGVCDENIICLCAAYGAQEEGDARQTIDLLGKAAEIAVENNSTMIIEEHVNKARKQINFDGVAEILVTLPAQLKLIALACIWDIQHAKDPNYICTTGTVMKEYKELARNIGIEVLTQRRVTDLLDELSEVGFIDAIVKYGKGRTKHITLLVPFSTQKILLNDYRLKALEDYRHPPHN